MTLLEKVKANLILEHDRDDELLQMYITTAIAYAESYQHVPEEATTETAGIVKMAANVEKITGDTVTVEKFNDLIDALVAAGLMADEE